MIRRNACETSVLELKKREKRERKQRIICVPILHSQFFSFFLTFFLDADTINQQKLIVFL